MTKHTHEELFELALIDVMWEVANKELVAVWVPDNPPAVHVTGFRISPATCGPERQVHKHIRSAAQHHLLLNFHGPCKQYEIRL